MDALYLLPFRPILKVIAGDKEGAVKDLTRVAGVVVGGVAGFALGGPVGAYAGGVTGGVAADGIITHIDSERKGVFSPFGTVKHINNIASGNDVAQEFVDLSQTLVADGLMGNSYGGLVGEKLKTSATNSKRSGKIENKSRKLYQGPTRDKLKTQETVSFKKTARPQKRSLDQYLNRSASAPTSAKRPLPASNSLCMKPTGENSSNSRSM